MKASAIIDAVEGVTRKWTKQRKREERESVGATEPGQCHGPSPAPSRSAMRHGRSWSTAYLKASANGTLPAQARQIMYAARPHIQATSDRDLGARFDQYFTQQLLPEYIEEMRVAWNVVYDARGHFQEPHTGARVPLGTLEVRDYLRDIRLLQAASASISTCRTSTSRPSVRGNRYGAVLFVEKEGFMPLFEAVKLGRALRPRHHVNEGDERHRQPAARRGAVRPARHPAPPPARFRQVRLLHRRHPEA